MEGFGSSPAMAAGARSSRGAGGSAASAVSCVTAANGTMRALQRGSHWDCDASDDNGCGPPSKMQRAANFPVIPAHMASYKSAGFHSQHTQRLPHGCVGRQLELHHSLSFGSDDGSSLHLSGSQASAYAATNEARVGRPGPSKRGGGEPRQSLTWMEVARCVGWQQVQDEITKLEDKHCDGGSVIDNGSNISNEWVTYRFYCAYHNATECPWRIRVRVCRFSGGVVDSSVTPWGRSERIQRHAGHQCRVDVCSSLLHSDHAGPQEKGPHLMFKLFAYKLPAMLGFKRKEIINWMLARGVQDPNNNQSVLLKKWCERTAKEQAALRVGCTSAESGIGRARAGTVGSLHTASEHFSFANVVGRENFSEHTPYMVPGSIMVPHTPGGPTSSLFTTLHCSLNLIRARMWYGPGGVAGAVDHTFKASRSTHPACVRSYRCVVVAAACMYTDCVIPSNISDSSLVLAVPHTNIYMYI